MSSGSASAAGGPMDAGKLDHLITLQAPVGPDQRDALGEPADAHTTMYVVWANKRPLTGSEKFAAAQTLAAEKAVWTVRWHEGITAKWRILDEEERPWDILSIEEIGRRQFLAITASTDAS